MESIDDVMNAVKRLSLEMIFAPKLLTWNINLHNSYKVEVWT